MENWKRLARGLKREVYTLYYAYRDPRVPWPARIFAACVVGYALSPIDLIPDFIPVVGYLDDLLLVPLGVWIAVKLIPPTVLAASREKAQAASERPVNRIAAVVILIIWLAVLAFLGIWAYGWATGSAR